MNECIGGPRVDGAQARNSPLVHEKRQTQHAGIAAVLLI